jgi:hypothetical protein
LRAGLVRRHPGSLAARQLAAPLLLAGLLTGRRRIVAAAYTGAVCVAAGRELTHDAVAAAGVVPALPCMHIAWGIGFLTGLVRRSHQPELTEIGLSRAAVRAHAEGDERTVE